jgi:hypothetical protein
VRITIVKVFSATKERDRESLGQKVKNWLAANPAARVVQTCLRLSSDDDDHCMTIVLFCAAP